AYDVAANLRAPVKRGYSGCSRSLADDGARITQWDRSGAPARSHELYGAAPGRRCMACCLCPQHGPHQWCRNTYCYWGSADTGPLRAHDRAVALALRAYFGQMPDEPRRCESSKWVSTMPTASINAYIVVGPTKLNPSLRSAFDSAKDSADLVGTSAIVRGCGVSSG